ncbi:MAG: SIS domain-containing protein [Armatimonadota bacterium]|nr:SIS domain-containing protein [Armatimonadota bacterium]MDR7520011.1 SIS domain-containing protein [Armatimonadota bacterium]MDR7549226.1 SIS domain-containing protein [Armatimonadota bacterium]
MAADFFAAVAALIAEIVRDEEASVGRAADLVADAVARDRLVHLFGTGHSRLLVEDGFFRAGSLACVKPILVPELTLSSGALAAMEAERDIRVADLVWTRYRIEGGDVLVVFSTSGVNVVPIEVARRARSAGAGVVAIASRRYMAQAPSTHPEGLRLEDVVDVLVDNHVALGDALVALPGLATPVGPGSTIAGSFLLHAIFVEAVRRLLARGITPPVYVSSKLSGADQHNAALVARYRDRITLLESAFRGGETLQVPSREQEPRSQVERALREGG